MTIKTKSSRHDIAEILLKLVLNTNQSINLEKISKLWKKMINFLYSLCTISKVYYLENYFAKKKMKKKRTAKTRIKCLFSLLHKISIKIISKYSKTLTGILLLTRGHYLTFLLSFAWTTILFYHICSTQFFILYDTFLF